MVSSFYDLAYTHAWYLHLKVGLCVTDKLTACVCAIVCRSICAFMYTRTPLDLKHTPLGIRFFFVIIVLLIILGKNE